MGSRQRQPPTLVGSDPGAQLSVFAVAREYDAELNVLVVRHRASRWVREIARKEEDNPIEAEFDPETGVVTVFEGRREYKALERAARRAGLSKNRVGECVPYRMLEVEVAANAVYAWRPSASSNGRSRASDRPIPQATRTQCERRRSRCGTSSMSG